MVVVIHKPYWPSGWPSTSFNCHANIASPFAASNPLGLRGATSGCKLSSYHPIFRRRKWTQSLTMGQGRVTSPGRNWCGNWASGPSSKAVQRISSLTPAVVNTNGAPTHSVGYGSASKVPNRTQRVGFFDQPHTLMSGKLVRMRTIQFGEHGVMTLPTGGCPKVTYSKNLLVSWS